MSEDKTTIMNLLSSFAYSACNFVSDAPTMSNSHLHPFMLKNFTLFNDQQKHTTRKRKVTANAKQMQMQSYCFIFQAL